jgi:DnaK suppressor protein
MSGHDKLKEMLEGQLADLLARAEALEDDLRHPLAADSEEQAIDLADDEVLAGTDAVLRREIGDVREALVRIERDEYGVCVSCGEDIAPRRLEVMPTATRCIKCA